MVAAQQCYAAALGSQSEAHCAAASAAVHQSAAALAAHEQHRASALAAVHQLAAALAAQRQQHETALAALQRHAGVCWTRWQLVVPGWTCSDSLLIM